MRKNALAPNGRQLQPRIGLKSNHRDDHKGNEAQMVSIRVTNWAVKLDSERKQVPIRKAI